MSQVKGVNAELLRMEIAETSYGTDPASAYCVKLPFNTFELQSTRNLIAPATITGRRDPVEPSQGFVDVTGTVTVPIDKAAIGYWLEMLLGHPVSTATGSAYSHVFTVNSKLNSYVLEQGFTDNTLYQKFNGVKAGGMSMSVGGDEELMASFDLVGQKDTTAGTSMAGGTTTTLTLSRFNQFDASLTEGGVIYGNARRLDININNNLDTDVYLITSGTTGNRGDLPSGLVEVSGEMEVLFENWSYYAYALSGTERSLQLTFQDNSFYLQFKLNELIYEQRGPVTPTPNGIWLTMPFRAYYDDANPDQTAIQVTLVNTWAAYSGNI